MDRSPLSPSTPLDRSADGSPAVSCSELSIRYGSTLALNDVSLDVRRGTIQAVVGPSGCGKSSFLMALNRLTDLVPGCRVEGTVRVAGQNIHDGQTDVRALRRRVGMVFQKPNPFPVSVRENLVIPLRDHGVRDRETLDETVHRALEAVGLLDEVADRLDHPARSLSGGQQQRLCIARALVLDPRILLMDEPCCSLDPLASGRVEDYIVRLRGEYTVIVVTHNLAQARRIADRTALFWRVENAGRLVEVAETESLFRSPRHELTRAYVDGRRG